MNIDLLAVGAHPDDVELGVGGMLHHWARRQRRIAILDLTRGELGTRGATEERAAEAADAAQILGIAIRENAGLPDGGLANSTEQQRTIIPFIRKFRPQIILAPMPNDRHPDHSAAHALVHDANFFSGLERIALGQERYRAPRLLYYYPYHDMAMPTLIVDISEDFSAKTAALKAHASQFFNPGYPGTSTEISSERFWKSIETRAAYWGSRIGVEYGEALYTTGPLPFDLFANTMT